MQFPALQRLVFQHINPLSISSVTTSTSSTRELASFLDHLTSPRLENLEILFIARDHVDMSAQLHPSILGLKNRSQCTLRNLTMTLSVKDDDLERLLRNIPTLHSLRVNSLESLLRESAHNNGRPSFVRALASMDSITAGPDFLPELREVSLVLEYVLWDFKRATESAHHLILDVLESRMRCPKSVLGL